MAINLVTIYTCDNCGKHQILKGLRAHWNKPTELPTNWQFINVHVVCPECANKILRNLKSREYEINENPLKIQTFKNEKQTIFSNDVDTEKK